MKSNSALQDKLTKQNEISRQKLVRELMKLEKVEKSDLRMIETERHRFRSRHKKLEIQQQSPDTNAINVRMYETHNPGFCYHCTGAMKESGSSAKKQTYNDSYEFVHSILFTNGEVDPDKVLCLHLLSAHSTKWNNDDGRILRPVSPLMEKAKQKRYSGPWNSILPCYVVDIKSIQTTTTLDNIKLHENPRQLSLEDQAIRDFEEKYKQYIENNADFDKALTSNAKQTRMAPSGLGKMPIISPHVYSLLGASHELRMKQAMVGASRKKFARSSMDLSTLDESSISFHLDDDDDLSRVTTNVSTRIWGTKSTRSPSRRSALGSSFKIDHGITMLKPKRNKPTDYIAYRTKNFETFPKELVTIKPSFGRIKEAPSKTSGTDSPLQSIFPSRPSTNSLLSGTLSPELGMKKYKKYIYFNSPIKCLRNKDYKTIPILVNYQIQALIHSVLQVLERVSPQKLRRIVETARDTEEIQRMLIRSEVQNFVQSLLGQSLVSSPESFVVSAATVTDEIDFRFEGILEKEIIALTLEMPPTPSLDALIAEIRNNIFLDTKQKNRSNENSKEISSFSDEGKVKKENAAMGSLKVTHTDKSNAELNLVGNLPHANAEDIEKPGEKYVSTFQHNSPEELTNDEHRESLADRDVTNERNVMPISAASKQASKKKEIVKNKSVKNRETRLNEIKSARKIKKTSNKEEAYVRESNSKQKHSGTNLTKHPSNVKTQTWKSAQDPGYLDADHVILRRMTNTQRILVGQMCASLKTKRINNEGLINERVPLAALITPALSRESIKFLTRGTIYTTSESTNDHKEDVDDNVVVPDKLTGPVLAKIQQDVAENETKRRLKSFLEQKI